MTTLPIKLLVALLLLSTCVSCNQQASPRPKPTWQARLKQELPALGHRNWIVVADSAYPKQSAPGIETVVTNADQLEVLSQVLKDIDKAPHVRAVVVLDQELEQVAEDDAPGVSDYRTALKKLLGEDNEIKVLPHEEIIHELDNDSKLFNVLLLKTNMTIPYTSVFIQLDCGYWNSEKEARLRESQ